jgi:integrase
MEEYLAHFRELVAQGKRSPTTLREIERYAKPEGKGSVGGFSYWYGRNARDLTNGDVEDWHKWLGKRAISPKTQKLISDAFRAFMRRLEWRNEVDRVPQFPAIEVPEYAPRIITVERQAEILNAIPWERRGAFLCAATEALRLSEIRALNIDDYKDGRLRVAKTMQGPRIDAPVAHTKNRSAEWRELWSPELVEWIEWRLEQATPKRRLAGEVALFWNPTARNVAKRWGPNPIEEEWQRACEKVGEDVAFQEGTRHCILTTLGSELPERMLQAFSRHRDAKSLSHYTKPRATRAAIQRAAGKTRDE